MKFIFLLCLFFSFNAVSAELRIVSINSDNSISILASNKADESVTLRYNIYYVGDNYERTSLYNKSSWIGLTAGMDTEFVLDDDFITRTWLPAIRKHVVNPRIIIEYFADNQDESRSQSISLK